MTIIWGLYCLEYCSPQNSCPHRASECGLVWNRVFANIIDYIKMRSQWIRVGPKSSDWSLYKRKGREIQTHRHTCREIQTHRCTHTGKMKVEAGPGAVW